MTRRRFKGSNDPNAIVLENLFPRTNIKLSTELQKGAGLSRTTYQEFVFEGSEEYLRFIEVNAERLTSKGWRLGDPLIEGESELRIFRRRSDSLREYIEIPVLKGWRDLSDHFVLANRVRLLVIEDDKQVMELVCDLEGTQNANKLLKIQAPGVAPLVEIYTDLN